MERAVACYNAALQIRPNFPQVRPPGLPVHLRRACLSAWLQSTCALSGNEAWLPCSRVSHLFHHMSLFFAPQSLNNLGVVYTSQGRAREGLALLQVSRAQHGWRGTGWLSLSLPPVHRCKLPASHTYLFRMLHFSLQFQSHFNLPPRQRIPPSPNGPCPAPAAGRHRLLPHLRRGLQQPGRTAARRRLHCRRHRQLHQVPAAGAGQPQRGPEPAAGAQLHLPRRAALRVRGARGVGRGVPAPLPPAAARFQHGAPGAAAVVECDVCTTQSQLNRVLV